METQAIKYLQDLGSKTNAKDQNAQKDLQEIADLAYKGF